MAEGRVGAGSRARRPATRVGRTRVLLVPLIGEPAFRRCVRAHRFLRWLPALLVVGVGTVLSAAFASGPAQLALVLVWAVCAAACLVGAVLLVGWARAADRLASQRVADQLGYPIQVRGGRAQLDVARWKRQIERAMRRYREAGSGRSWPR